MDDTRTDRTRDSTREYEEKEPMSPAKLNQHEPTAVRREPSNKKIINQERNQSQALQMLKKKLEEAVWQKELLSLLN